MSTQDRFLFYRFYLAILFCALSFPAFAGVSTANRIFLDGADIFGNLSEIARTATQDQFDKAMAELDRQSPAICAELTSEKKTVFLQIVDALKLSWQRKNRTDVLLYSIEAYRFLTVQVKGEGDTPAETGLLDVPGFCLHSFAASRTINRTAV